MMTEPCFSPSIRDLVKLLGDWTRAEKNSYSLFGKETVTSGRGGVARSGDRATTGVCHKGGTVFATPLLQLVCNPSRTHLESGSRVHLQTLGAG